MAQQIYFTLATQLCKNSSKLKSTLSCEGSEDSAFFCDEFSFFFTVAQSCSGRHFLIS